MKDENEFPATLQEAIKYFSKGDVAFEYMKSVRWPTGKVSCPRCQSEHVSFISTRKVWTCMDCKVKKQFTIRIGTILEDSAIPFEKWICAFWLIANAKNGISSYELGRSIGVTQRTGWFMLQRIRLAMQNGTIVKLDGEVEADETYIGARARNMHAAKKRERMQGRKGGNKHMTAVQGLLQRHGKHSKVILKQLANTRRQDVMGNVHEYVVKGSQVFTDSLQSYRGLKADYDHKIVDHAERYVDGKVHTNGLENFWSLLKRTIKGTYVNVEPFHLFRYLDEQSFRFNERGDNDQGRFEKAIKGIVGKSLTYSKLTNQYVGDNRLELVPA